MTTIFLRDIQISNENSILSASFVFNFINLKYNGHFFKKLVLEILDKIKQTGPESVI